MPTLIDMKPVFIYALCEPGTRTVRYIGQTLNPEKRFREHVWHSRKRRTHLGNWIRELQRRGVRPNLVVIREVPYSDWPEAERSFIRIARGLGMRLVNSTEGGEGVVPTSETRKKLRERWSIQRRMAQAERMRRVSEGNRGRSFSKEHRDKLGAASRLAMTGRRKSASHCAAMREAQVGEKSWTFGKPHSPEHARNHLAGRWRRKVLEHSQKFYGKID